MMTLERARAPKVTWVSLVGLILVPLLVAAGFLWATWNSDTRLDRVQAAIVNNDEGTTLNDQFVPLGRQLAGGLVNGEDDTSNFDWVLTDTDDARDGLESGTYAAVVTIPADFSKQATSFSKTEVADIAPGHDRGADLAGQRHHRRRGRPGDHHRRPGHAQHRADRAVPGQHLPGLQLHQEAVPERGQGRAEAGRRQR